jgi:hypothetical protein
MEQVLHKVGVYIKTKDRDKLVKVVARNLSEADAEEMFFKKNEAMGIKVDRDGCFIAKPGQKFVMIMD